jgi:hypothetical protein
MVIWNSSADEVCGCYKPRCFHAASRRELAHERPARNHEAKRSYPAICLSETVEMLTKLWYNEGKKGGVHMDFIFFAIVFAILLPVVLWVIFAPMYREKRISNGINNQDIVSKNYLFKINGTKQDFLRKIGLPNVDDILKYSFDPSSMIITFRQYDTRIPCKVFVKELDNSCYIRLNRYVFTSGRSNIPYYINEFMTKKFNAELLPYKEYKNLIT